MVPVNACVPVLPEKVPLRIGGRYDLPAAVIQILCLRAATPRPRRIHAPVHAEVCLHGGLRPTGRTHPLCPSAVRDHTSVCGISRLYERGEAAGIVAGGVDGAARVHRLDRQPVAIVRRRSDATQGVRDLYLRTPSVYGEPSDLPSRLCDAGRNGTCERGGGR